MKKILLLFSFLICISLQGQIPRYPFYVATVSGTVYTDDFEAYTDATTLVLNTTDSLWRGSAEGGYNAIRALDNAGDGRVISYYASNTMIVYNNDFADDQYAEIKLDAVGTGYMGVAVRLSGTGATFQGYVFYASGVRVDLEYYYTGGAVNSIAVATAVSISAGSVLRIEAKGDEIKCYINGSLYTGGNFGSGIFNCHDAITSGKAGVSGYGNGGGTQGDDWKGGDL
jgi:hypothetical protein